MKKVKKNKNKKKPTILPEAERVPYRDRPTRMEMYDKLACYELDGSLRQACEELGAIDTSLDF